MKTQTQHFDRLGRELAKGDVVAFSSYFNQGLTIGRINRLMKVRAEITGFVDHRSGRHYGIIEDINSNDLVKLNPEDVAFYLLKNK